MPISSGALGWPKSYWSPPPVDTRHIDRRVYPAAEWAQKIINDREWKKRRKATRAIAQKAKQTKERKRRRRKCLLVLLLLLFTLLLAAAGFLVWYFIFKDKNKDQVVAPVLSCKGKWRRAFLGYKNQNGTYTCCYDVNPNARSRVLANGDVWPSGYVINKTECNNPSKKCLDVYKSKPEICTNGCTHFVSNINIYFVLFLIIVLTNINIKYTFDYFDDLLCCILIMLPDSKLKLFLPVYESFIKFLWKYI